MQLSALRYLTLALKHPLARQTGLLRGGFGIESRARTYSNLWQRHLDRSKRFVLRGLGPASGSDTLLILGAGRLYDVPIEQLTELYKKIYLIDADPGCQKYHQLGRGKCEIISRVVDVTGWLGQFIEILRFIKFSDWEDAMRFPDCADLFPVPSGLPSGCDVISMNVLSQLSLPFRDLFEAKLKKQFGKSLVEHQETEWLVAFHSLGARIVRGHFDLLKQLKANQIVLITDTEHAFYKSAEHYQEAPITPGDGMFQWNAIDADVEPIEVSSALSEVDIAQEISSGKLLPAHKKMIEEIWPWHIVPPTAAEPGQVNRVEGFFLTPA